MPRALLQDFHPLRRLDELWKVFEVDVSYGARHQLSTGDVMEESRGTGDSSRAHL